MLNFQFFPRSNGLTQEIKDVISCFEEHYDKIDSETNNLTSNAVLNVVRKSLERIGFTVEKGKDKESKIDVPVLFGKNNVIDKSFYADALSADGRIVIEVEAGRATENNQF